MSAATEAAKELRELADKSNWTCVWGYGEHTKVQSDINPSTLKRIADKLDPPPWKPVVGQKARDLMGHVYTVVGIESGYAFIKSGNGGMSTTRVDQLREYVALKNSVTIGFVPKVYYDSYVNSYMSDTLY